jgi:hypothetical protein
MERDEDNGILSEPPPERGRCSARDTEDQDAFLRRPAFVMTLSMAFDKPPSAPSNRR